MIPTLKRAMSRLVRTLIPIVLIYISFTDLALGRAAVLRLNVQGEIKPTPIWVNESGPIDHLNLDFSQFVPSDAHRYKAVDSTVGRFKLVNGEPNSSIRILRPQLCSIGSIQIRDFHVQFIHNKMVHSQDENIQIDEKIQEFSLRFAAIGGYYGYKGYVRCEQNGSITYTYN